MLSSLRKMPSESASDDARNQDAAGENSGDAEQGWETESSQSEDKMDHQTDKGSSRSIVLVTVHGLHTGHGIFKNQARTLADSSTIGQWINHEFRPAAVCSRKSFQDEASKLLRKISGGIKKEDRQPIVFVPHDIGGSIVKEALYVASLDQEFYYILHSTKMMVFHGCPHRSLGLQDMEDKIAQLILAGDSIPPMHVTTSAQNLALSVRESNDHFVETKILLHANLMNIFSRHEDPLIRVFDKYTSTMDLSVEMPFSSINGHVELAKQTFKDIEEFIKTFRWSHADRLDVRLCWNMIVSLSSPIHPPSLPSPETCQLDWVINREEFVKWYSSPSSEILILHGQTMPRILHEYLSRYVEKASGRANRAMNFSFDKGDARFNTFGAFLNTTIAEWSRQDDYLLGGYDLGSEYRRCKAFNAFNDTDAMNLLMKMRDACSGATIFVLENDDECAEMDTVFWNAIKNVMENWDKPWKFLLLRSSGKPMDGWLSDWPTIHVSKEDVAPITASAVQASLGAALTQPSEYISATEDCRSGDDFKKAALVFRNLDALLPLSNQNSDERLASIKERINRDIDVTMRDILQLVPPQRLPLLGKLVSCALVAKRPLNRAEFQGLAATLCGIDSGEILLSPEDPFAFLERHLPGVFDLSRGETRLQYPELRSFLFRYFSTQDGFEESEAERTMGQVCLAYLRSPAFAHAAEAMLARRGDPTRPPISSPRIDFADYVSRYWHVHMNTALDTFPSDADAVVQFLQDEPAVRSWEKSKIAISNPVLDKPALGRPPLALLASTGLCHRLEQWNEWSPSDEVSMRAALTEDAAVGDVELVKTLLGTVKLSKMKVAEPILSAALGIADEETLLLLVSTIAQSRKNIQWPPRLICRASELGHSKLVKLLIQNRASLNVGEQLYEGMGPLHLSAQHGHAEVTELLLKKGPKDLVHRKYGIGLTALHDAVDHGCPRLVKMLIHAGAKMETPPVPIVGACGHGKHAALRALIEEGAKLNEDPGNFHSSLLNPAIMQGYTRCVEVLLRDGKVNAEFEVSGNNTPHLCMAVAVGRTETIRLLLDYRTNPDREINPCPALAHAVEIDYLEAVRLLVERGNPSPESRTKALYTSVKRGTNVEMVRFLLQNGADVGARVAGVPLICHAAYGNNPEVLKALIEYGANVDDTDAQGGTPLHVIGNSAVTMRGFGFEDLGTAGATMTKILLEAGSNLNAVLKRDGLTPLHRAIFLGQTDVVKALLEAKPDLKIKTGFWYPAGASALALAAWEDKAEITKLLLAAGADPNSKTAYKGGAPLHLGMDEDVVRALLEYDPDLALQNDEGDTPLNALLSLTREKKQLGLVEEDDDIDKVLNAPVKQTGITLPVVEILLRKGSDVNHPNRAGQTPLFKALARPDLDIARLLLSRGANPHHISRDDGMPLHSTCRRGTFDAFKLMLEKAGFAEEALYGIGSLVNAACMRDDDGGDVTLQILQHLHDTVGLARMNLNQKCGAYGCALSAACFRSSESVVAWLLEKGARVQTKDHADRSPIHFAAYRNVPIFKQICEAGGDIKARDKTGRSILHIAVQSGSAALVKLILEKDPSLLNARDNDNWAPLHYAVRGCWHSPTSPTWMRKQNNSQANIVKLLLDDGICSARDFTVRGHEDERWSVLMLAHYHGAKKAVRRMLEASLKKQQGRNWDPWAETIGTAYRNNDPCDYCFMAIDGIWYNCKQCLQYNLCYKCHGRKNKVHPGHHWDPIGQGYEEDNGIREDDEFTDEEESMGENGEDYDESMGEDVEDDDDVSMGNGGDTDV